MVADDDPALNPYASPQLVESSRPESPQDPLIEPLLAKGPVRLEQYEQAQAWVASLKLKENRGTAIAAIVTSMLCLGSLALPGGWPMAILFAMLSINGWYQWSLRRQRVQAGKAEMTAIAPQDIRFRLINGGGIVIDGGNQRRTIPWSRIRCHSITADGTQLVLATTEDCQVFTPEHFEDDDDWALLLEAAWFHTRPG